MGFRRPSVSATAATSDSNSMQRTPELSVNTHASPQPKESSASSTPHSSPWRENPAFLPPNNAASTSQADKPNQSAGSSVARNLLPEVTERLADMSVVGSGLQRGQSQDARELAARLAQEAVQAVNAGNKGNALGRLKDRQQQSMRETSEDGGAVNPAPARYYMQVPSKPFKP